MKRTLGLAVVTAFAACTLAPDTDRLTNAALAKAWEPARAAVLEHDDSWRTFAAVSRRTALSRDWEVWTFSTALLAPQGEEGRLGWIVRRDHGRWDIPASVDWASSTDCTAIETVLVDLEMVRIPGVDAPRTGWDRGDRIVATADGASYGLVAGDFQHENATAWRSVELSAASGSVFGDWVEDAIVALAPCWSSDIPATYE